MRPLEHATSLLALALAGCSTPDEPRDRAPSTSTPPQEVDVPEEQPPEPAEAPGPPRADPPEEPAQDTAQAEEASPPEPAPPCEIRIVSTLDATVYRGVPRTPALEASRQRRSPDQLERDRARDHGSRYLSCDYVVELDGDRYLHTYESSPSPFDRPDPAECEEEATKAAAVARLRRSTRECTDLDRGAFYGVTLEAMP